MPVPVYILGEDSPQPFTGAFRVFIDGVHCWLRAYGYIAVDAGVVGSYLPARRVEAAIKQATNRALRDQDRFLLLRSMWEELQHLSAADLGPNRGTDLCLVVAAGDADGVELSAVGVSGIWGRLPKGTRWIPIVPPEHPLLCPPGIAQSIPGSLTINSPPMAVLATTTFVEPVLPNTQDLARRIGRRL